MTMRQHGDFTQRPARCAARAVGKRAGEANRPIHGRNRRLERQEEALITAERGQDVLGPAGRKPRGRARRHAHKAGGQGGLKPLERDAAVSRNLTGR